jgi:hypothetical protein
MYELIKRYWIVAALALVGCSSPMPSTRALQDASAAIGAAEASGAREHPQAALHLTLARESLASAERLIADEEMSDARLMLGRAKADALLAQALARVGNTRMQAAEVARKAHILEQETVRRAAR